MFLDKGKQAEIKEALSLCRGSERFYDFPFADNFYSDGVAQMAVLCQASWLVTDALVMCKNLSRNHQFIVVEFQYTPKLNETGIVAIVTYSDGNKHVIHKELLQVTDFPLESLRMFYENNTLYLPSER